MFCLALSLDSISCSLVWPQTHGIAEDHVELLIFLPLPHQCWGDWRAPECPGHAVFGIKPKASDMPHNHSTFWAISPAPGFCFSGKGLAMYPRLAWYFWSSGYSLLNNGSMGIHGSGPQHVHRLRLQFEYEMLLIGLCVKHSVLDTVVETLGDGTWLTGMGASLMRVSSLCPSYLTTCFLATIK